MRGSEWDVQDELTAAYRKEGELLERIEAQRGLIEEARAELDRVMSENKRMKDTLLALWRRRDGLTSAEFVALVGEGLGWAEHPDG